MSFSTWKSFPHGRYWIFPVYSDSIFKMSHYIKVAYRSQKAHLGRFITRQSRIHYKWLRNCISLPDSCNFREIIKSLKRTIIKFSKTAEKSRFGSWKLHNFWWHFHRLDLSANHSLTWKSWNHVTLIPDMYVTVTRNVTVTLKFN